MKIREERRVSVRAMVESVLMGGDIARTGSVERMMEGLRGHQRLQGEYGELAKSEVTLSTDVEGDAVRLKVHGRADVVWFMDGAPAVVEEIKTTRRDPCAIGEDEYPLHWAQAHCYGHILCSQYGLSRIDVRLTYARADGRAHARITRAKEAAELARRFDELASAYIAQVEERLLWLSVRDASLGALPFPYESFRPGQRAMAAAAYRACRDGGQLLCEAPTGIGKTAAMLFSALKALGEGHVERVFYLTARGTTRLAAEEGLAMLRAKGLRARSLTLTAKEKVCAVPGAACMPDSCPRAAGHYDRYLAARAEALAARDDFRADYLDALCQRHALCPYEFALDLSLDCDVVIGDYNYAFDPFAHLRRYFDDKSEAALLIDEAHNLPERARDMFSAHLNRRSVEKLRREVGRLSRRAKLYRSMTQVIRALKALEEGGPRIEGYPADLAEAVELFVGDARDALSLDVPYAGELLDAFFAASAFAYSAALMKEEEGLFAALIEPPQVALRCLKPAPLLGRTLGKVRSSVFFSATLTPAPYFRDVLGAGEARNLRLPSPFPPENLLVLSLGLPVAYRAREQSASAVAASICALCAAKEHGNYLIFFPSYAYLRQVMPLVGQRLPDARLIVQRGGMDDDERAAFLGEFSQEPDGVLIAFAVMGGLFGEGVDLPGARLSGCAVVGIGLPQIGAEREALRLRYDEEGDEGFAYAYVYPGLTKVVQAAGRVNRTPEDRGVVLLIDERFSREEYDELFPPHWSVRQVRDAGAVLRAAKEFWAGGNARG